jgi:hypothetical protein
MEQQGSADELLANWSLAPEDLALLDGPGGPGRLGLAVQLAFWRQHSRFPDDDADVPPATIAYLASQVGIAAESLDKYDWLGRTGRRHRRMVLDHLAIATLGDTAEVLPREPRPAVLEDEIAAWFAGNRIVRPGTYRLDRIVRSASSAHAAVAPWTVAGRLDAGMRERLNEFLPDDGEGAAFTGLTADPGRVDLESLLAEIAKLDRLRALPRRAYKAVFKTNNIDIRYEGDTGAAPWQSSSSIDAEDFGTITNLSVATANGFALAEYAKPTNTVMTVPGLTVPRTQASGVPDQWGETPELIRELVPISEDVDVIDIIAACDVRWAR